MYAVYITAPFGHNDVLQSAHCLELVLAGTNNVYYGSRCDTINAGDIHFRKKGSYRFTPSPGYSAVLVFIENEFIDDFLEEHITTYLHEPFEEHLPPFTFRQTDFIKAHITEAVTTIETPGKYASCIIRLCTHQVLLHMLNNERDMRFVSFLRYLITDKKADLAYFMEEHFTSGISLKELALKSGRSLTTFKKDFATTFGTTPMKWLLNRRLEYANLMLVQNVAGNISDIAYECGFENLAYFSKVYRQKYGIPPSASKKK